MRYDGSMGTIEDILAKNRLKLEEGPDGLALSNGAMRVRADFGRMKPRLAPSNLKRELLVRAAKLNGGNDGPPTAADATAGLGDDALLLAAAGFEVTLLERNPVIAALLRDGLARAARDPALEAAAARMRLVEAESVEALPRLGFAPDVVLLDPMFPEKRKGAASKKKLQMLQLLEEPCADERALLDAAIAARPRKIVVKRPAKGPSLAGQAPSYTLRGKAIRYDVIALSR